MAKSRSWSPAKSFSLLDRRLKRERERERERMSERGEKARVEFIHGSCQPVRREESFFAN